MPREARYFTEKEIRGRFFDPFCRKGLGDRNFHTVRRKNITNKYMDRIKNDMPLTNIKDDSFRRDSLVEMIVKSIQDVVKDNHPCVEIRGRFFDPFCRKTRGQDTYDVRCLKYEGRAKNLEGRGKRSETTVAFTAYFSLCLAHRTARYSANYRRRCCYCSVIRT